MLKEEKNAAQKRAILEWKAQQIQRFIKKVEAIAKEKLKKI